MLSPVFVGVDVKLCPPLLAIAHVGGIVFQTVNWLMVCHPLLVEWVKSTDSTTSVRPALRLVSSFWRSAGVRAAFFIPAWDIALIV